MDAKDATSVSQTHASKGNIDGDFHAQGFMALALILLRHSATLESIQKMRNQLTVKIDQDAILILVLRILPVVGMTEMSWLYTLMLLRKRA